MNPSCQKITVTVLFVCFGTTRFGRIELPYLDMYCI